MKKIETTAKTVEEAIEKALKELNTTKENVEVKVIEEPSKGFLNMFGAKPAKVEVTLIEKQEAKQEEVQEVQTDLQKQENTQTEEVLQTNNDDRDYIEEARKFLRDILNNMDIMAEIKIKEENDVIHINLTGPKMGLIIGYRGETLDSLQYLVSLVVNKGHKFSYKKVVLDTENYRQKREETLKRLAVRTAEKARKARRPFKLEPMNPYERRIIHSALQEEVGIKTYSEGEEPYRRIVIDVKR